MHCGQVVSEVEYPGEKSEIGGQEVWVSDRMEGQRAQAQLHHKGAQPHHPGPFVESLLRMVAFTILLGLLSKGGSSLPRPSTDVVPQCGPLLMAAMEGKVHPSHCLPLLTSRPACELYGPPARGTCFHSQGSESFWRKLQS